jgi:hypothetical protein
MCLSPININGQETFCRECWQCRREKLHDYVGRCIAEQETADVTIALTLTYADPRQRFKMDYDFDGGWQGEYPPEDLLHKMYPTAPNCATLVYSDFQKMLKYLRVADPRIKKVRYIVAGEYGSKKNRAHWHAVLFISGKKGWNPDDTWCALRDMGIEMNKRVKFKAWKHGHTYVQNPDMNGFKYVLKYLMKDQEQSVNVSHFAMSKGHYREGKVIDGPLGYDYFMERAEEMVSKGIHYNTLIYKFASCKDYKGRHIKFRLRGRMREMFEERYTQLWREKYGKDPITELGEKYLDNATKQSWTTEHDISENAPWWPHIGKPWRRNTTEKEMQTLQKQVNAWRPQYYTPWEQTDEGLLDKATITVLKYQGIQCRLYSCPDRPTYLQVEDEPWQELNEHVETQIRNGSEIIYHESHGLVLREALDEQAQEPAQRELSPQVDNKQLLEELRRIQSQL